MLPNVYYCDNCGYSDLNELNICPRCKTPIIKGVQRINSERFLFMGTCVICGILLGSLTKNSEWIFLVMIPIFYFAGAALFGFPKIVRYCPADAPRFSFSFKRYLMEFLFILSIFIPIVLAIIVLEALTKK